jgi:hypothetical protein
MALEVMISVSNDIYQRAEKLARQQHQEVAAVIENVLDEALPQITEDSDDERQADEAVEREGAAYRRLHPELKQKFLGQYVAIYGGKLVDHDSDQVELYLRVKARYLGEFVWIAPVQEEPEEVYTTYSPRFVEEF